MNQDGITIKIHHGGIFSEDGELNYIGGEVSIYRNCDIDRMSYFELVGMAKDLGFNEGDKLYYTIPGYNLDAGIDKIDDDSSVNRMLKFAKPKSIFDVYIQHVDHHEVSGKAIVDQAPKSVSIAKLWERPPANQEILMLWHIMRRRRVKLLIMLYLLMMLLVLLIKRRRTKITRELCWYDPVIREKHLSNMIKRSDILCLEQIRMDRRCFKILCSLVRDIGGLKNSKNMSVEEMVAIFLHIVAYDEKQREMKFDFQRSQETISRRFHHVLRAILKLWRVLLKTPQPISEDCKDERWKWFKNCLGALDGAFIKVNVRAIDQARYRCRKNYTATNVLGVCAPDMQFIYVLSGWEGSAADGRILRDAQSRPNNGFKVPRGLYYLVDAGYKNCEGFLAPYRGQRYHLQEWTNPPRNKEELFNMKHSSARNVIERTFGLLKIRWGILRNPSFYSIKSHSDIILACSYLHNLIRQQMSYEPLEKELEEYMSKLQQDDDDDDDDDVESVDWGLWRDQLAQKMWDTRKPRKRTK